MTTYNEQISTTSILSLFDTTREERRSFVNDLVSRVANGEVNPLHAHIQVKKMEDIIKAITSNEVYKACILSEAEKNGKSTEIYNAKIEITEVGVKYDYSQCGDSQLSELMKTYEETGAEIKQRETFLKSIPASGVEVLNEQTGEIEKLYPPSKSSSTSIKVSLK